MGYVTHILENLKEGEPINAYFKLGTKSAASPPSPPLNQSSQPSTYKAIYQLVSSNFPGFLDKSTQELSKLLDVRIQAKRKLEEEVEVQKKRSTEVHKKKMEEEETQAKRRLVEAEVKRKTKEEEEDKSLMTRAQEPPSRLLHGW